MDWELLLFEAYGECFKYKPSVGQWEVWLESGVVGGGFALRKAGKVVAGGGGKCGGRSSKGLYKIGLPNISQ